MSTDFVSTKPIIFDHLKVFDFKGVSVDSIDDEDSVILTDGTNYLWAVVTSDVLFGELDENGDLKTGPENMKGILFTRYAGNYPEKIILAIEEHFGTNLISESDDAFEKYVTYD